MKDSSLHCALQLLIQLSDPIFSRERRIGALLLILLIPDLAHSCFSFILSTHFNRFGGAKGGDYFVPVWASPGTPNASLARSSVT